MSLNTFHTVYVMPNAHDFSISRNSTDFQSIRQGVPVGNQRMISCNGQWIFNGLKNSFSIMVNGRNNSVLRLLCFYNICTKILGDSLMTKADAKYWNAVMKMFYHF